MGNMVHFQQYEQLMTCAFCL